MSSPFFNVTAKLPLFSAIVVPPEYLYSSDEALTLETKYLRAYRTLYDYIFSNELIGFNRYTSFDTYSLLDSITQFNTNRTRSDVISLVSELTLSPKLFSKYDTLTYFEILLSPVYKTRTDSLLRYETSSKLSQTLEQSNLADKVLKRTFRDEYDYTYFVEAITAPPTSFTFDYDFAFVLEYALLTSTLTTFDCSYVFDRIIERAISILDCSELLEISTSLVFDLDEVSTIELSTKIFSKLDCCEGFSTITLIRSRQNFDVIYATDYLRNVTFIREDRLIVYAELFTEFSYSSVFDAVFASDDISPTPAFFAVDSIYPAVERVSFRTEETFERLQLFEVARNFVSLLETVASSDYSLLTVEALDEYYVEELVFDREISKTDVFVMSESILRSDRMFSDCVLAFDGFVFNYVKDKLFVTGVAPFDSSITLVAENFGVPATIRTKSNVKVLHGRVDETADAPQIQSSDLLLTIFFDDVAKAVEHDGSARYVERFGSRYYVQAIRFNRGDIVEAEFDPMFFANFVDLPITISEEENNPEKKVIDRLITNEVALISVE